MRGVVSEALASDKVVSREGCTEGSQTAKSGTDEQKSDMRLLNEDKQAHHCNVRRIPKSFSSRSGRDWRKGKAFTKGYLDNHGFGQVKESAEVIVVASNEPMNEAEGLTRQ